MSEKAPLLFTIANGIATITINRPEQRNAMNGIMQPPKEAKDDEPDEEAADPPVHALWNPTDGETSPLLKDGKEGADVRIFRYLMERGLDPMLEDGEQRSSLDVAMASGSVGILEIFKREK